MWKLKINPFLSFYYPDNQKENAETAVYALRAKLVGGRVKLDEKHVDFRWVSREDWRLLKYTPSALATLRKQF